jgi:hypothetical protein
LERWPASCFNELIPEQLFQLFARRVFARIVLSFRSKRPSRKIEVFAKIPGRLLLDRIGAAVATLVRDARVVTRAIKAYTQIRIAPVA